MKAQTKDGHRMQRPVITRTVPTTEVRTWCECGIQFDARDRFQLRRMHAAHRKSEAPTQNTA